MLLGIVGTRARLRLRRSDWRASCRSWREIIDA
jgi:hypothetical protein